MSTADHQQTDAAELPRGADDDNAEMSTADHQQTDAAELPSGADNVPSAAVSVPLLLYTSLEF